MSLHPSAVRTHASAPARLLALLLCLAPLSSLALDDEPFEIHIGGDVKGFYFSVFPYESPLLPDDPFGQAVLDFRLKADLRHSSWLRVELHHQLTTVTSSAALLGGLGLISPAQGQRDLPQAAELDWSLADDASHSITGRIDRATVMLRFPRFHLTAGRQAISFGRSYFFTPLDLVAPFSPTVIDREYKPGIDALRADYYFGVAGQVTVTAAYAGSWDTEGMIFAARAGSTIEGWDLALFGAAVQRDAVLGLESSGALGPVSVRAEGSLTFPSGDDDPFVRVVAGADHMLMGGRLQLSGELYHQSLGAEDASGILRMAMDPRVARGELWTLGRWYAGVSANYELTPILHISAFSVANLTDPSFLLGPGISWSVADAARVVAGAHLGIGERPDESGPLGFAPQSEFGLYPASAYVSLQAYF